MFRDNRLKRVLAEGRIAIGGGSHLPSTVAVEMMGLAGDDFVLIDTEHGTYDIDAAGELVRAAHGAGITPLVRVLRNDPGLIMKALDLGAHGVVIPHIRSRTEAMAAVDAAKYPPFGSRGSCPYVAAAGYSFGEWRTYQEWTNNEVTVMVLIEDEEGVKNVDEIVSVRGVDMVFLGPFDMSVGMGLKGDSGHPEVTKNLEKVTAACVKRGLPVMYAATTPEEVKTWAEKGVRLFVHGSDIQLLVQGMSSFLEEVSRYRRPRKVRPRARPSS